VIRNDPAVGNVCEKRFPGFRSPESHTPALSDVVVCGSCPTSSQFTHVTVAPGGTWIESGWNAKSRNATKKCNESISETGNVALPGGGRGAGAAI